VAEPCRGGCRGAAGPQRRWAAAEGVAKGAWPQRTPPCSIRPVWLVRGRAGPTAVRLATPSAPLQRRARRSQPLARRWCGDRRSQPLARRCRSHLPRRLPSRDLRNTEGGSCCCAHGLLLQLLQPQREPRHASSEVRGFLMRPSKLRMAVPAGSAEVASSAGGEVPRLIVWRP
jgi:hypothetical protein